MCPPLGTLINFFLSIPAFHSIAAVVLVVVADVDVDNDIEALMLLLLLMLMLFMLTVANGHLKWSKRNRGERGEK